MTNLKIKKERLSFALVLGVALFTFNGCYTRLAVDEDRYYDVDRSQSYSDRKSAYEDFRYEGDNTYYDSPYRSYDFGFDYYWPSWYFRSYEPWDWRFWNRPTFSVWVGFGYYSPWSYWNSYYYYPWVSHGYYAHWAYDPYYLYPYWPYRVYSKPTYTERTSGYQRGSGAIRTGGGTIAPLGPGASRTSTGVTIPSTSVPGSRSNDPTNRDEYYGRGSATRGSTTTEPARDEVKQLPATSPTEVKRESRREPSIRRVVPLPSNGSRNGGYRRQEQPSTPPTPPPPRQEQRTNDEEKRAPQPAPSYNPPPRSSSGSSSAGSSGTSSSGQNRSSGATRGDRR